MDYEERINSQIIEVQIPSDQIGFLKRDARDTRKEIESLKLEKEAIKQHLATYKRILGCEVGQDIDLHTHIPIPGIWKVRAGEKNYLKSELIKIIDLRRRNDPAIPLDPKCLPSDVDANRECLLSASQLDALLDLYASYNAHRTADEQEAAKCIKEYQKTIKDYEEKLLHNSAMVDEIKATRKRIKEFQIQFAEDQDFMSYLISMESCREKIRKRIKSSSSHKQSNNELDRELLKYKGMLEANQREEHLYLFKLDDMQRRLSNTQERLIEAENLCEQNKNRLANITKEVPLLMQMPGSNIGINGNEEKKTPNLYTEDKLEMARCENDILKQILKHEIFLKDKDFDNLKKSLDSVASAYRNKIMLMRDKSKKAPSTK